MPSNLLPSGHGPAHRCNRCTQEPRSDVFVLTTRGRHSHGSHRPRAKVAACGTDLYFYIFILPPSKPVVSASFLKLSIISFS